MCFTESRFQPYILTHNSNQMIPFHSNFSFVQTASDLICYDLQSPTSQVLLNMNFNQRNIVIIQLLQRTLLHRIHFYRILKYNL